MGRMQYVGENPTYDLHINRKMVLIHRGDWVDIPDSECFSFWIRRELFEPCNKTGKRIMKEKYPQQKPIKGLYSGKCFILGSGSSMNDFDYSILDGQFKFAVNHMHRRCAEIDAVIFNDTGFLRLDEELIRPKDCLIFAAARTNYEDNRPNVYHFPMNTKNPQNEVHKGLYHPLLSGLTAINMAVIMGFSQIYLLGYDMKGKRVDNYGSIAKDKYSIEEWAASRLHKFEAFKPYKHIFNCTVDSAIKVFPHVPLEEAIICK